MLILHTDLLPRLFVSFKPDSPTSGSAHALNLVTSDIIQALSTELGGSSLPQSCVITARQWHSSFKILILLRLPLISQCLPILVNASFYPLSRSPYHTMPAHWEYEG